MEKRVHKLLYLGSIDFGKGTKGNSVVEGIVFSTNGTVTIGYPDAKKKKI